MPTQVDITETTASNFASDAVLVTDSQIHGGHVDYWGGSSSCELRVFCRMECQWVVEQNNGR